MNVLCVTNMYPSVGNPSWGCFVREQVEDLESLGVEIRVFAFDGRQQKGNYLRAARELRRLVRSERFDVVHAHYGLSGAVALAQRRVPVITTFHGSETGYVPWQRYVSWVVARLTAPIFVSDHGAEAVGCSGATVIPCGVDTELFTPMSQAEAKDALGLSAGIRYVLFPGRRAQARKRFDLFEAALAIARRSAPDLEPLTLEDAPRAAVALVINACDATVMTSDYEGSPVTVRESLSCNTPVVSVPVGDVESVLTDLPGCAVVPREPQLLAEALLAALDAGRQPALRTRAELTSRRRIAERIAELYERTISAEGGLIPRERRPASQTSGAVGADGRA
jgi:glycosyltransferase involved in cell wall biosynthesis